MQTFLPVPDFRRSLRVLDPQRLTKQVLEAAQLLNGNFSNHPAYHAWLPRYRPALKLYLIEAIAELARQGHSHALISETLPREDLIPEPVHEYPWWFGNPVYHRSHRTSLIVKDPEHYTPRLGGLLDTPPPHYSLVWPIHHDEYVHDHRSAQITIT